MEFFFSNLLLLCLEAAPWLVIGLLVGGLFKAIIPSEFLQRHLQDNSPVAILKAALLGAPLPLCSCGVIPAAMGLRKAGASKSATVSFLVSTPETGIDSISISYALLGPVMAIARPVAAIVSAITAGLLVGNTGEHETITESATAQCCHNEAVIEADCCSNEVEKAEAASCCTTDTDKDQNNVIRQIRHGIQYAFTDLLDNIILWLVVGLVFAALVKTFVPTSFLSAWGSGLPAMLLMIIIGIPMYVCATASTPIAAGLIMAGISPGTALVFLMAGPATNISTLGVIGKELGRRSLIAYLSGVTVIALISGLFLDYLISYWTIDIQTQLSSSAHLIPQPVAWSALILLLVMACRHLLKLKTLLIAS